MFCSKTDKKYVFFQISWYFSVVLVIWSSPASALRFFIFEKNKIRVSRTLFWSEILNKTIGFHQKPNSFVGIFSTESHRKYFLNIFKKCLLWEHFFYFQPSLFFVFSTKNMSFNKIRMLTGFSNCHFLDDLFIVKMRQALVCDPK